MREKHDDTKGYLAPLNEVATSPTTNQVHLYLHHVTFGVPLVFSYYKTGSSTKIRTSNQSKLSDNDLILASNAFCFLVNFGIIKPFQYKTL